MQHSGGFDNPWSVSACVPEAFVLSTSLCFSMISCNAKKDIEHNPNFLPFFPILGPVGEATFHREVEVCAFHQPLPFAFIILLRGIGECDFNFSPPS